MQKHAFLITEAQKQLTMSPLRPGNPGVPAAP